MFTNGQQVKCVNADKQPTLELYGEYTVREVTPNGVRVASEDGPIKYDFKSWRFAPAHQVPQVSDSDREIY